MFHVPTRFLSNNALVGNACEVPHPKISDYVFICIFSNGMGWEHVSISLRKNVKEVANKKKHAMHRGKAGISEMGGGRHIYRATHIVQKPVERCPTWEEMCFVKDLFWDEEDCVVQYHPPKSEYVSNHPYCLHLWRPTEEVLPRPATIMVGLPGIDVQTL